MRKIIFMIIILLMNAHGVFAASINTNAEGVALKGYDAVAYFTQNQAVMGKSEIQDEWMGVRWYFANEEHKQAFIKNPEKYAPQYGGYCAFAVSQGSKADIDPDAWTVIDGKLYLNVNQAVRTRWLQNSAVYIQKADENWSRM